MLISLHDMTSADVDIFNNKFFSFFLFFPLLLPVAGTAMAGEGWPCLSEGGPRRHKLARPTLAGGRLVFLVQLLILQG